MGTVYAAYDDQLDRKVAIKILSQDRWPAQEDRARFLREAQALARLSHRHVVAIHEVGEADGELFLAMDFIHGQNLSQWLDTQPSWRETLEVFVQVGSGLTAVHESGLVHRDLKPGNIMRRYDGTVKLLDFGLARAFDGNFGADDGEDDDDSDDESLASIDVGSPLTHPGALVGTPAYMSPEQLDGGIVDARSDQFSFCTALYEALYGERPFPGDDMPSITTAVLSGSFRAAPKDRPVPARLRAVLLRGLAADPDDRWPSMEALTDRLSRLLAPRRARWWGATAVAGLGVGVVGLVQASSVEKDRPCTGARAKLEEVWDGTHRDAIQSALLGTERNHAADTWTRVEQRLDDYAEAWVTKHTEVCEATAVRKEQSSDAMQLRMRCMEQRRRSLRAAVEVLTGADAAMIDRAVTFAGGLPALDRCDDLGWLEEHDRRMPPPENPETRAQVDAARDRLADVNAMTKAGRYPKASEKIESEVSQAEALQYGPLQAEALHLSGLLSMHQGKLVEAEQQLKLAYTKAVEHHHDETALDAATSLTFLVGHRLARHAEGRLWGEMVAMPLALRSGDRTSQSEVLSALGSVCDDEGNFQQSEEYHQRSLDIRRAVFGDDHYGVARNLNNLGNLYRSQGKYDDARSYLERALAIKKRVHGAGHPNVASGLHNLGLVLIAQRDLAGAKALLEQALTTTEDALGPDHLAVANNLNSLVRVHADLGEYAVAKKQLERVLGIFEQHLGPDHPNVGMILGNLGNVSQNLGQYDEAQGYLERSLAINEKARGPDHFDVASSLAFLGRLHEAQKDFESATVYFERALPTVEATLGPNHPRLGILLGKLGTSYERLGEHGKAAAYLERALKIGESVEHGVITETDLAAWRTDLATATAERG